MKTLKTLAILLLIVTKTLPLIIQYYKTVYKGIISSQDAILEKAKSMEEADKNIKTTYIKQKSADDIPREKIKIVEEIRRRQRAIINERYNKKFGGILNENKL